VILPRSFFARPTERVAVLGAARPQGADYQEHPQSDPQAQGPVMGDRGRWLFDSQRGDGFDIA
jgi:hypothetical protein